MKHLLKTAAIAVLAGTLALGGAASAQNYHGGHNGGGHHQDHNGGNRGGDRDDHRGRQGGSYGHNNYGGNNRGYQQSYRNSGWHDRSDWRPGGYVARNDWDRGYRVDYRSYRGLYAPPYGYEWRRVDNNYVLAQIASGLIASLIINGGYNSYDGY